ncbi:MAG: hypothetical protein WBP93_04570, partial [Pyrinomonadaceae bacterium]
MKPRLIQLAIACCIIFALNALANAQDSRATNAPSASVQQEAQGRTSADETFELNITERRITENNFEASTSIEAGDESARGLHLRIGVGVGAERIDVLLRNVRGMVRFRGTLDRVLD